LSRLLGVVLSATFFVSACKIERTPREYFDHEDPVEVERAAATDELRARLLAAGQALSRGDAEEAAVALAPAADAVAIGPDEGEALSDTDGVTPLLRELVDGADDVDLRELRISVGPGATVAWFSAYVDVMGQPPAGEDTSRLTGVYLRSEGAWTLVQAHLSRAIPLPSPAPAADSVAGG
jgi:hypothetical protein